jgi:hypothetical protein
VLVTIAGLILFTFKIPDSVRDNGFRCGRFSNPTKRVRPVNLMNVAQIKDEIRKLNRTDKIEICRWIDREVRDDISRIGMARSIQIRQEFEQICKAITGPERRVHLDNREQDSFDLADQASRRRARATGA